MVPLVTTASIRSVRYLWRRFSKPLLGGYGCLARTFSFYEVKIFLLTQSIQSWTRGTGLMGPTNIVAHELQSYGVRTLSANEIASNGLGLNATRRLSLFVPT